MGAAATSDINGDDDDDRFFCASNCQLVCGTLWYLGLFTVNGIYLYLIICWKWIEKNDKHLVKGSEWFGNF